MAQMAKRRIRRSCSSLQYRILLMRKKKLSKSENGIGVAKELREKGGRKDVWSKYQNVGKSAEA